jgi:hypothetical protein
VLDANWIHCKENIGDCVPLYKKDFKITHPIKSAFLYISARGVYEATMNGKRVGDFILCASVPIRARPWEVYVPLIAQIYTEPRGSL